jgi:hypothetical protein
VVGFGAAYGAGRAYGLVELVVWGFGVILRISLNLWVCRCGLDWFWGIPHSYLLALMDTRGLCFKDHVRPVCGVIWAPAKEKEATRRICIKGSQKELQSQIFKLTSLKSHKFFNFQCLCSRGFLNAIYV